MATDLKLGILLWSQTGTWPELLEGARRVDRLGYDHLWAWDHLYAIFGDPYQPYYEGWGLLHAWAMATERARLGLLVGAVPYRNPGLVAKLAVTLDHVSNGRAILGMGGSWFDFEAKAHGIDFGRSPGQRLDWLDEALGAIRTLLDGGEATSPPGGHYAFDRLRHRPLPLQPHLPIMIGGAGERKTLRTVARYADMWNAMGAVDEMRHKIDVLRRHCDEVGRDPTGIEFTLGVKLTIRDSKEEAERVWKDAMAHNRTPLTRAEVPAGIVAGNVGDSNTFWNGTPEQIAEKLRPYVDLGFHTVISEQPAPYDTETLERFIGEVKPLVDRA